MLINAKNISERLKSKVNNVEMSRFNVTQERIPRGKDKWEKFISTPSFGCVFIFAESHTMRRLITFSFSGSIL